MGYSRVILVLAMLFFAGALLYYFTAAPLTDNNTTDEVAVEHLLEEFELIENVGPDKRWVLFSPRAYRSDNRVNLQNPEIQYIEGEETLAEIYSHEGQYDLAREHLRLQGEVVIKRPHLSQKLLTDYLEWYGKTRVIKTDSELRLELSEGVLTARGLKMDIEEERLELKSEVKFQGY